jgi:hypothetical protein
MKVCEFLLQKEGDRVWLPIESPTVEILEGRYRIVARTRRPQTEILVEVSYWSPEEMPPKRRTRHWNRRTNEKGVMPVLPFTTLRSGNWQIQCSSDLLADMGNEGWKQAIELRVLAQDEDLSESDEPQVARPENLGTQKFAHEELVDNELVDKELVDKELVNHELVNHELVDKELVDKELVNKTIASPMPTIETIVLSANSESSEGSASSEKTTNEPSDRGTDDLKASAIVESGDVNESNEMSETIELAEITGVTETIAPLISDSVSDSVSNPVSDSMVGDSTVSDSSHSRTTVDQLRELAEAMSQLVVDTVLEVAAIEDSPTLDEAETVDFFTLTTPENDFIPKPSETWTESTIEALDLPEPIAGLPFVLPDSLQGVRLQLSQNTIVPGSDGLFKLQGQIFTTTGERLIESPLPLQARVMLQNPNNMEIRLALTYLIAPNPVEQPLQLSGHIALDWKNQLLLGEVQLQALSLSVDDLSEFVYVLTSEAFTVMPPVDSLLTQAATGEQTPSNRPEWDFDLDFLSDDDNPTPLPVAKPRISADFLEVTRRSSPHLSSTALPSASEPSESSKSISPSIGGSSSTSRKTTPALDLPNFLKPSTNEFPNPEPPASDSPETIVSFTSEQPEQLALLDLNEWTDPNIPATPEDTPRKPVLELPPLPTYPSTTDPLDPLDQNKLDEELGESEPTIAQHLLDGIALSLEESQEEFQQEFQNDHPPATLPNLALDNPPTIERQTIAAVEDLPIDFEIQAPAPQDWFETALAPEPPEPQTWAVGDLAPWENPSTETAPDQPVNPFVDPFLNQTDSEELPLHLTLDPMPLDRSPHPPSALTNILSSPGVSALTSSSEASPPETSPSEISPHETSPALDSTLDEDESTFQALMDIFAPEKPEVPLKPEEPISSHPAIPLELDRPPTPPNLPPNLLSPAETSLPPRAVGEFFDEFEPTSPHTQNDRALTDPTLDSFFSEPIASPSLRLDFDEDLLDLSSPLPAHLRLSEDSGTAPPDRLTQPFIPEPWRGEVVVEDEWLQPDKRHWMSLQSPTPAPCLPQDTPIPVPSIDLPSDTLIAGEPVTLTVRLPQTPSHLLVKVWMLDCQSRTLAADPYWIRQFLPTLPGFLEAIVDLTVPLGCLEIQLEAMTIEPASQRESHKFSVVRAIVPADLVPADLNDLAPLPTPSEIDRSENHPDLDSFN